MFNLLIKKEYRDKFKFTNFLYNDLWSLCEQYFGHTDERMGKTSIKSKAVIASYNLVLFCGKTAIDDNTKPNIDSFIKKQSADDPAIFCDSVIIQLFDVAEKFLKDIGSGALLNNFRVLKDDALGYMGIV